MHKVKRLAKDGAWVLLGQILSIVAVLTSFKLWAVYLDPTAVGLIGLIAGLSSAIVGVAVGPLSQSALVVYANYVVAGCTHEFRAAFAGMALKTVLTIVVIASIVGIPSSRLFGFSTSIPLIVAGLFVVDAWRVFETTLFAAARRQKQVAIMNGGDALFRTFFSWLALTYLTANAYTVLWGTLAGSITFLGLAHLSMRLEAFPARRASNPAVDRSIRDRLRGMSRPLYTAFLLANVAETLNRYLIAATIGLGSAGLFFVTYGLVKRPYGLLNSVVSWTMGPVLANAIAENNIDRAIYIRWIWLMFGGGVSLIGVILFYAFRDQVVSMLLSAEYSASKDLIIGLAIAIALGNIANIFGTFSLNLGNSRAVLINNSAGSAAGSILMVFLCLYLGLPGAVWALVVGNLVQLLTAVFTYKSQAQR
jgi:O-antigen/teichoic acid export membrane protein